MRLGSAGPGYLNGTRPDRRPLQYDAERVERAMVKLARWNPMTVYVVREGERTIGRVVAPVGEPILGPGAETVLLQRGGVSSESCR